MPRPADPQRHQLWQDRLDRFAQSELTVAEFCRRESISVPSFYPWKKRGLQTLLDAWSQFSGELKILGDGPQAGMVKEFGSRNPSIQSLGQQRGDVVQHVVGQATALIVPSTWYEGLPKTIIEAFSVGTPIVASDLGAMSEVIETEKTGVLFQPGDSERLLDALRWMAEDPARVKSMRREVRAVFEQRYTADHNFRLLMDIYNQVLNQTVQPKS